eukprot:scaffold24714_cov106-Isochrysis_galbana.AAC.3
MGMRHWRGRGCAVGGWADHYVRFQDGAMRVPISCTVTTSLDRRAGHRKKEEDNSDEEEEQGQGRGRKVEIWAPFNVKPEPHTLHSTASRRAAPATACRCGGALTSDGSHGAWLYGRAGDPHLHRLDGGQILGGEPGSDADVQVANVLRHHHASAGKGGRGGETTSRQLGDGCAGAGQGAARRQRRLQVLQHWPDPMTQPLSPTHRRRGGGGGGGGGSFRFNAACRRTSSHPSSQDRAACAAACRRLCIGRSRPPLLRRNGGPTP